MHEFVASSVFFGVFVTLAAYLIGMKIRQKTGLSVMNPILIAVALVIALLSLLGIDYSAYNQSAKLISNLLTPATICLAVPLYEQIELLRRHKLAIFLGVLSGVVASLVCVLALSLLFGLDHASYVTLLPKSITSAIGTSSHAIGTTRAMELGEIEGAMSGLSIVIAGVLTVIGASVFSVLL